MSKENFDHLDNIVKLIRTWNAPIVDCKCVERELRILLKDHTDTIDRLSYGYTNVSFLITDKKGICYKLSVFVDEESYLSKAQLERFLHNRNNIYDAYGKSLGIIYHDWNKVLSHYIDGVVLTSVINEKADDISGLTSLLHSIVKPINEFHSNLRLINDFDYLDLTDIFFGSLIDQDLLSKGHIPEYVLISKIDSIKRYESSFSDEWFALSHRDTDPINMVYTQETNKISLIDFEFVGKGLIYYDYANCYNVLKNILFIDRSVLDCFVDNLLIEFPHFNRGDFFISVEIMTFIWGIWYYLYGLKFDDKRLTDIGIDWINELSL